MTGLGGDASLLYYDAAARRLTGLNGTGRAPREASIDRYRALGCAAMPLFGPLTITVPGAVDAWWLAAERHGRRPLRGLLAPAIAAAEQGVPVGRALAAQWRSTGSKRMPADPDAISTYTVDGRFPDPGEVLRQPNLALTLAALAEGGRDAFYRGPIARALVRSVRDKGGLLALDDLAEHHSEWVEPVLGTFRALDVAVRGPRRHRDGREIHRGDLA
jgi:gamma-glutamyltranspeptidase/glutathione hydrolase